MSEPQDGTESRATEQPPEGNGEPRSEAAAADATEGGGASTLNQPENAEATVKLVLLPGGHVITMAFPVRLSVRDLKALLAPELQVPVEVLRVSVDGGLLEEQLSLLELGVWPQGSTQMEVSSADPAAHPLRPRRPAEGSGAADVLTVRVQTGGVVQEKVVEIERRSQRKAFLGGYRHRVTGAEYHHAAVQTLPKKRPDRGSEVTSRDTQTVLLKSEVQQCPHEVATQMSIAGCFVSCAKDRLVSPGPYVTGDQFHDRRLKAAIRLQALTRRWLAQQRVARLRRQRDRRLAWLEATERGWRQEREEQQAERRRRWTNPRRMEDFNLLYNALEKWWSEEERRINTTLQGAARRAALCELLEQETQHIATIGLHRSAAVSDTWDRSIRKFLDKCAAPLRWVAADGRPVEMDSLPTARARLLRDIYTQLTTFQVDTATRQRVLETLKHTVQEQKCQLTRDLVELIDRELDLMRRSVKASSLEGLRTRITTLFLQYIKTPAFNPEVAKYLKVHQSSDLLRSNMSLCRSCNRYMSSSRFRPSASDIAIGRCLDCTDRDNAARHRDDFSRFKIILRRLQADELRLSGDAQIPFLLQVEDVRYLVEMVWASRSVLHGSGELYDLVLVRWDRWRDWSPWNCILLSKNEAKAHTELEDINKGYDKAFIRRIQYKHMLAWRHFSQISKMAEFLKSNQNAGLDAGLDGDGGSGGGQP
ncbi:IQ motif and ubiquitin-like domain-containing protein isoform X2 [Nelusetta ayraudi]|uniref:IQ motif and ubiquitin-like domain-containing protein isoform X2 n=1 Tax=Nelusetta ayraudi TaxID=303726 RepID=UPI003F7285F4